MVFHAWIPCAVWVTITPEKQNMDRHTNISSTSTGTKDDLNDKT